MKNPSGFCMCGCGRETALSPTSRRGYKRGEPLRYIKGHSSRKPGPDYHLEDRGYQTPCWIWQKHVDARHGYGRAWDGEQVVGAHRLYFERYVRPLDDEEELHHLCEQKDCVSPFHVQALPRRLHMSIDGRLAFGNPYAKVRA